jgi:hypothetical protein
MPKSSLQDLCTAIVSRRFLSPFLIEKTRWKALGPSCTDLGQTPPGSFLGDFSGLSEDAAKGVEATRSKYL